MWNIGEKNNCGFESLNFLELSECVILSQLKIYFFQELIRYNIWPHVTFGVITRKSEHSLLLTKGYGIVLERDKIDTDSFPTVSWFNIHEPSVSIII